MNPAVSETSVQSILLSGNAQAAELFTQWQEKFGEYLVNFARYRVSCSATAEDLVQETFVSAWRSRKTFQGKSSTKTWLVQILKNKIIDHFNKFNKEQSNRVLIRNDAEEREDIRFEGRNEETPEEIFSRRETLSRVYSVLDRLPEKVKTAFLLRTVEERPAEEVCRLLSVTESNLWVMVHRARKKLEEQLGTYGIMNS